MCKIRGQVICCFWSNPWPTYRNLVYGTGFEGSSIMNRHVTYKSVALSVQISLWVTALIAYWFWMGTSWIFLHGSVDSSYIKSNGMVVNIVRPIWLDGLIRQQSQSFIFLSSFCIVSCTVFWPWDCGNHFSSLPHWCYHAESLEFGFLFCFLFVVHS